MIWRHWRRKRLRAAAARAHFDAIYEQWRALSRDFEKPRASDD